MQNICAKRLPNWTYKSKETQNEKNTTPELFLFLRLLTVYQWLSTTSAIMWLRTQQI